VVLIPTSAPLLCEIEVGSSDIGDLGIGDPVLVKVDAFPFQRFGGIQGHIRSIGMNPDTIGALRGILEAVARKGSLSGVGVDKS